jgi:hypothetical protein
VHPNLRLKFLQCLEIRHRHSDYNHVFHYVQTLSAQRLLVRDRHLQRRMRIDQCYVVVDPMADPPLEYTWQQILEEIDAG